MKFEFKDWGNNFQTPIDVCDYMSSYLPSKAGRILEPTPGKGNLVTSLSKYGEVICPENFFELECSSFDYIVMNPPFSPMKLGYDILYKCMEMSENIIALMPYLTLINSDKRTTDLMRFGLKSITHLPRNTFKGSRVQTCIIELVKGYRGETKFSVYKN